ncbi:hypothetical protein F2Q70_00039616 [Brassica cretica]|uniref:Uncharacterized protein n=1 Tax=Brassica cretica TaxID=69181 RepID=A0A8S9K6W3_BRACR|nr:hypothetical protein F2Q70_00039616 [Brassica cretica]
MESSPSTIINTEVLRIFAVDPLTTTPSFCAFESPSRYALLGDGNEAETGASCSLSLTRGARETKPPVKYQDMEWKTFAGENKSCERQRRVVLKSSRTNLAAQDTVFLKPLSSVSPYATSRIISEYLHNPGATICPPPRLVLNALSPVEALSGNSRCLPFNHSRLDIIYLTKNERNNQNRGIIEH